LALRKTAGATTWSLSAYHHRVHDYIYGRTLDVQQGLQLLQYSQQDALFTGLEAQLRQRLNAHWGVTVLGDLVRARFAAGGDLPRIPAARAGLRLDARWQGWQGEAEWLQVARQNRVAALETPTPGYGMLNLGLSYRSGPWQLYAKGQNLTNRLAWAHTSFIKEAAPLAGRNLVLGLRVDF
ncbi:MAG: TonB-dependent receptor, partial [Comamonadaceae bacterium]|nr:TonB-dependent receptor [Comamonadaceae bacterium]